MEIAIEKEKLLNEGHGERFNSHHGLPCLGELQLYSIPLFLPGDSFAFLPLGDCCWVLVNRNSPFSIQKFITEIPGSSLQSKWLLSLNNYSGVYNIMDFFFFVNTIHTH